MYCLPYLRQLRREGVNAEIYPDAVKIQKQMKYADQRNIPVVVMALQVLTAPCVSASQMWFSDIHWLCNNKKKNLDS